MVGRVGLSLMPLDSVYMFQWQQAWRAHTQAPGQHKWAVWDDFQIHDSACGHQHWGRRQDRSLKHHDGAPRPWLCWVGWVNLQVPG